MSGRGWPRRPAGGAKGPRPTEYDYDLQVWVVNGHVVPCGHPDTMRPHCCNGHKYAHLWIEEARALEGLEVSRA